MTMKMKTTHSLSSSEELEAVVELVLKRMLSSGFRNLSATHLEDDVSTLHSKITVPENIIASDGTVANQAPDDEVSTQRLN